MGQPTIDTRKNEAGIFHANLKYAQTVAEVINSRTKGASTGQTAIRYEVTDKRFQEAIAILANDFKYPQETLDDIQSTQYRRYIDSDTILKDDEYYRDANATLIISERGKQFLKNYIDDHLTHLAALRERNNQEPSVQEYHKAIEFIKKDMKGAILEGAHDDESLLEEAKLFDQEKTVTIGVQGAIEYVQKTPRRSPSILPRNTCCKIR